MACKNAEFLGSNSPVEMLFSPLSDDPMGDQAVGPLFWLSLASGIVLTMPQDHQCFPNLPVLRQYQEVLSKHRSWFSRSGVRPETLHFLMDSQVLMLQLDGVIFEQRGCKGCLITSLSHFLPSPSLIPVNPQVIPIVTGLFHLPHPPVKKVNVLKLVLLQPLQMSVCPFSVSKHLARLPATCVGRWSPSTNETRLQTEPHRLPHFICQPRWLLLHFISYRSKVGGEMV